MSVYLSDGLSTCLPVCLPDGLSLTVDGDGNQSQVSLQDFMNTDMKGKVITAAALPTYSTDDVYIRTFRVAQRLQVGAWVS